MGLRVNKRPWSDDPRCQSSEIYKRARSCGVWCLIVYRNHSFTSWEAKKKKCWCDVKSMAGIGNVQGYSILLIKSIKLFDKCMKPSASHCTYWVGVCLFIFFNMGSVLHLSPRGTHIPVLASCLFRFIHCYHEYLMSSNCAPLLQYAHLTVIYFVPCRLWLCRLW